MDICTNKDLSDFQFFTLKPEVTLVGPRGKEALTR